MTKLESNQNELTQTHTEFQSIWLENRWKLVSNYFQYNLSFIDYDGVERINMADDLVAHIREVHENPKVLDKAEGDDGFAFFTHCYSYESPAGNNYLELATTYSGQKVCIYIGDSNAGNKGKVFLFGAVGFTEWGSCDSDGNVDYDQGDVYDFTLIADSFEEFLGKLYCKISTAD